jgi:MFS family permease
MPYPVTSRNEGDVLASVTGTGAASDGPYEEKATSGRLGGGLLEDLVTDRERGDGRAGFALAILFAINLLNFFDRNLFGALAEPIKREWSLSDTRIGFLALAFTVLYAVVGVPLGRLSDRRARPPILAIGVAVWSLLTAASGLAWNYASLFVVRLGVGIGEASCAPAANSMIGDYYPAKRRAWALGIFMLGLPIGNFLSSYFGGHWAAAYGWRKACFIACVPGLLLAAFVLLVKDPPRGAAEISHHASRAHEGSAYWCVLKIPTVRWLIISGALHNFMMYTIAVFVPGLLARYHGLNLKDANSVNSIVFGLVGIPGLLIGGSAADRAGKRRPNGRLLTGGVALLCAAPCMWLANDVARGKILNFTILMGTGVFLAYFYYTTVYAAIQDVVQPSLRATAMAIFFCAMYLLGGSFGPVITGRLSDHFASAAFAGGATAAASRAIGLHSAMYIVPFCVLGVALVLFAAARSVGRDMEKLQAWMAGPWTGSSADCAVDGTAAESV